MARVKEAERVIVNGRARYYEAGYKPLLSWVKSLGLDPHEMPRHRLYKFGPLVVGARLVRTRKGRPIVVLNEFVYRPVVRLTFKRLPAVPDA